MVPCSMAIRSWSPDTGQQGRGGWYGTVVGADMAFLTVTGYFLGTEKYGGGAAKMGLRVESYGKMLRIFTLDYFTIIIIKK